MLLEPASSHLYIQGGEECWKESILILILGNLFIISFCLSVYMVNHMK